MDVKILSTGCCHCHALENRLDTAIERAQVDVSVEKIEDMQEIMSYNVMSTPALVVDGEIRAVGRTPSVTEIVDLLTAS